MRFAWFIWPIGAAILVVAGFVTSLLPRRRARVAASRIAWSAAQAAIETAGISRDAAAVSVPEAEQLLMRAELLAARHGGPDAASDAADCAKRADELWRATAGA
jgi:Family of unknown function (DUF6403)